eukprot:8821467-Ditylum_brightwellii.AAC.1
MNQLSKCVDLPYLQKYGLVGKPAAWAKSPSRLSCNEGLKLFLEDLKQEAEPHAKQVVRDRAQAGLCDNDIDLVELLSSMTKWSLYHRFYYKRGYMI